LLTKNRIEAVSGERVRRERRVNVTSSEPRRWRAELDVELRRERPFVPGIIDRAHFDAMDIGGLPLASVGAIV